MNRTALLAIVAAVVLVAAFGLWRALADDGDAAPASSAETTDPAKPAPPVPRDRVVDPSSPSLPTVTSTERGATRDAGAYNEYAVGDVRIRDHRGSDAPIADVPPTIHHPNARRLPSSFVHDLTNKLRDEVVADCAGAVAKDALGPKPKVEGQVVVAIKAGQAGISKATIQPRDVADASIQSVKQCIEQKALTVTMPVANEADLDSYAISVVIAFP